MTRSRACSGEMFWWLSKTSATWNPLVSTGLSAVIGSWKISPTSLPRTARSAACRAPISSLPRSFAEPLVREFLGSRPRIPIAVTDLPEPDSPTTASTSPGLMARSTSREAITHSPSTRKSTPSPLTSRIGGESSRGRGAPGAWVSIAIWVAS